MPWIVGALVAAGSFCLQVYPRMVRPLFGIDVWRHLLIARFLRRHRRLPRNGELSNHLFAEGTDYPPLLRVLLAGCPSRWWLTLQRFLAPLFDAAHCLTLFGIVWGLTRDPWAAALAQVAYLVNPLVILENSNLTTRSFSSLLFTWSMWPLLAFAQTHAWGYLALAIGMMALLLLSHRLAVQALGILVAIMTAVDRRGVYLAVLGAAMGVALLISRGFYLKVLRGHLLMLDYWWHNSRNRFAHQIRGLAKTSQPTQDVVHELYQWLAKLPAAAVVAGFPMAWFAVVAAGLWWWGPLRAEVPLPSWVIRDALIWALGLLGAGMVIRQVPALRFLGEGERYGEYAAFPVAVLTAAVVRWGWTTPAWAWWLATFLGVAVCGGILPSLFLQRKVIVEDRERSITPDHEQMYEVVRSLMLKTRVRLATIPLGLADALTYFTDCPVLATDSSLAHWRYYSEFSPTLRRPLAEILVRHGVTHLLVNRSYVSIEELKLTGARLIASTGPLVLLELATREDFDEHPVTTRPTETARAL